MWRCPETNGYVLGFPVLAGRLYICPRLGSAEAAVYPPPVLVSTEIRPNRTLSVPPINDFK